MATFKNATVAILDTNTSYATLFTASGTTVIHAVYISNNSVGSNAEVVFEVVDSSATINIPLLDKVPLRANTTLVLEKPKEYVEQKMDMDKKDLISFFQELRLFYADKKVDVINNITVLNSLEKVFETYDINKLDIKRMYRYLDKNIKKEVLEEDVLEEGEDI